MLQPAPGRRFPSNSPHPEWLIFGTLLVTAGAVAAAVGLLLQHAAATQVDTFHPATAAAISSANHALLVGAIWMWSGAITTAAGVVALALALQEKRP